MLNKLTVEQIRNIIEKGKDSVSKDDQAEMAIPTYLHNNALIRWLMWQRYKVISNFCGVNKNKSVLEFGCGIGIFLPTLSRAFKNVYAIDLFPIYAKMLSSELDLGVNFINELNEINNDSIEIIIAADVMEHLDNPEEYAYIFKEKLVNGGKLIISGPTENFLYKIGRKIAEYLSGNGDFKSDYHHTNIDRLERIIINCGFTLTRKNKLPFIFMPPLFKILEFKKINLKEL